MTDANKIFDLADLPTSARALTVAPAATDKAEPVRRGGTYSAADDVRAAADEAALKAAGFALKPPVYRRGTTVISTGVENARGYREEWDRMPTAAEECGRLAAVVRAEGRKNLVFTATDLRMTGDGSIGPLCPDGKVRGKLPMEADSIPSIFTRVSAAAGVKSPGSAVSDPSWGDTEMSALRCKMFNTIAARGVQTEERARIDADKIAAISGKPSTFEKSKINLRTRLGRPDADGHRPRQVFAAVSDSYAAVDTDRIAEACALLAKDTTLRGESHYDGRSCTIKLIGNTDVRPEHFVAGEVFRAGISVKSDDTGKGGIRVSALMWRNLCLNLIILDKGEIKISSLRHIGSADKLAAKLADALKAARDRVSHFLTQWGIACKRSLSADVRLIGDMDFALDELAARAQRVEGAQRELLSGTFRGLAEEDRIPLSMRTVESVMGELLAAHDDDRNESGARQHGPTRASVANALTLYAHDYQNDPDTEYALEVAAGRLLSSKGKLPFYAAA